MLNWIICKIPLWLAVHRKKLYLLGIFYFRMFVNEKVSSKAEEGEVEAKKTDWAKNTFIYSFISLIIFNHINICHLTLLLREGSKGLNKGLSDLIILMSSLIVWISKSKSIDNVRFQRVWVLLIFSIFFIRVNEKLPKIEIGMVKIATTM